MHVVKYITKIKGECIPSVPSEYYVFICVYCMCVYVCQYVKHPPYDLEISQLKHPFKNMLVSSQNIRTGVRFKKDLFILCSGITMTSGDISFKLAMFHLCSFILLFFISKFSCNCLVKRIKIMLIIFL